MGEPFGFDKKFFLQKSPRIFFHNIFKSRNVLSKTFFVKIGTCHMSHWIWIQIGKWHIHYAYCYNSSAIIYTSYPHSGNLHIRSSFPTISQTKLHDSNNFSNKIHKFSIFFVKMFELFELIIFLTKTYFCGFSISFHKFNKFSICSGCEWPNSNCYLFPKFRASVGALNIYL